MNKRQQKREISDRMIARAFEIRMMTGRGQSREELMKDQEWSELNDKLNKLK